MPLDLRALLVPTLLLLVGCPSPAPDVVVQPMPDVADFHYQLQDIAPDPTVDYPRVVIADPTRDGSEEGRLEPEELGWFVGPDEQQLLLAYVSIGEAESYRAYWRGSWDDAPPAWVGPENPDWAGNFKVRYWNADWRELVLREVATICEQGFDGLYADIVDAYYFWSEEEGELDVEDAAVRMLDLMAWIVEAGQEACGDDFLLVPQNGAFVGDDAADDARYFELASAIGVEDVFFPPLQGEWMDAPFAPDTERVERLEGFDVPVLSVEYVSDPADRGLHDAEAEAAGFVPGQFCRALDRGPGVDLLPCPE
jgi:cysteinyl-tRNA synthetase, unknown class